MSKRAHTPASERTSNERAQSQLSPSDARERLITRIVLALGGLAWLVLFIVIGIDLWPRAPQVLSPEIEAVRPKSGSPAEVEKCLMQVLGPTYHDQIASGTLSAERVAEALPICFGERTQ